MPEQETPNPQTELLQKAFQLHKEGKLEEAEAAYTEIIKANLEFPAAYTNLATIWYNAGKEDRAISLYEKAIEIWPNFTDAYNNLGVAYQKQKQIDKAIDCFKKAVALDPERTNLQHLINSLSGTNSSTAPEKYVTQIFDDYANNFENSLVNKLNYKTPEHLSDLLDETLPNHQAFDQAIDLGCGTGLSGVAFQRHANHMVGIDLSQNMLDKAKEKKLYQDLIKNNLIDGITQTGKHFDLFFSVDVVVYIGDIAELFDTISKHANPDAIFCLSTERLFEGDYKLLPTGRYAHTYDYIIRTAKQAGLIELAHKESPIRTDNNKPIIGGLFIFRKDAWVTDKWHANKAEFSGGVWQQPTLFKAY